MMIDLIVHRRVVDRVWRYQKNVGRMRAKSTSGKNAIIIRTRSDLRDGDIIVALFYNENASLPSAPSFSSRKFGIQFGAECVMAEKQKDHYCIIVTVVSLFTDRSSSFWRLSSPHRKLYVTLNCNLTLTLYRGTTKKEFKMLLIRI